MRFRRIAAILSAIAMLVSVTPFTFAVTAEEKDVMDNFVVYTIHEKKQFIRTNSASGGGSTYGNAWVDGLNVDMSAVAADNLALSMRFYYEDFENPTNTDLFTNSSNVIYFSDALGGSKRLTWKISNVKTVNGGDLVPGEWNDILLPFSTGTGFDQWNFATDKFTFWWMEFSNVPSTTYTVRLSDVAVVDTSRPAAKDQEEVEWDTSYLVGNIPFTLTKSFAAGENLAVDKVFSPIDASKHNPASLSLAMDITFQNLTNPGDVSPLMMAGGQIELTSSGKCDVNEANHSFSQLQWREGTNEYLVPLSSFGTTGGALDLSAINYMRIYMNNWPAGVTDRLRIEVTNVRIIDTASAPVLPTLFSDNMMFQQNKPMNLWGFGDAESSVTATLYKGDTLLETKTATADQDGRWDLSFSARKGGYDTYTIRVEVDGYDWEIRNVIVGELWLACGQSNMELWIGRDMDATAILEAANNENIRVYCEPLRANGGSALMDPAQNVPGAYWCLGNNTGALSNVSSIAYTFAKTLQEELDVPVGIINAALGATVIEAWLSREAIAENTALRTALQRLGKYYDEEWWPSDPGTMSTWYNAKIGPLAGMNIAGTIWHQGESNSSYSEMYGDAIAVLKRSWGDVFGFEGEEMPFIFAQISPYNYGIGKSTIGYLSEFMERGWAVCDPKTTAMLPLYDLPLEHMLGTNTSDPIHPRIKTPVGKRYALAALNMMYGGKGEFTAPVFKSFEVKDNAVFVTFDRVGEGLCSLDGGDLHGFTVAGEDGIYVNARAEIVDTDTVKVWNNYVNAPTGVMYAFDDFAQSSNLANADGIPASPFRTAQPNDTVSKQDKTVTRFTAQDWMHADRDVWVYDESNTEHYKYGYRPSFKVNGGRYTYDSNIRAEGIASLRMEYSGNFTVSPILTYPQVKAQTWGNFKTLSVSLLNPTKQAITLSLTLTSGSKTYHVPLLDGTTELTLNPSQTKFAVYTFDLSGITQNGNAVLNPTAVLNAVSTLNFNGTAEGDGTVFFDAFSFGLTDAVTADAELNRLSPTVIATYDDLLNAIQEASNEDLKSYTVESGERLRLAIEKANATYDRNPPATLLEVTDVLAELKAAMAELEPLPPVLFDLGDVDENGKIDSTDARLTLQYAVGKIDATKLNAALADVDGNNKTDSTDARLILQYAVGKIKAFPSKK